ncbi:MAG: DUF92 domain-containing protein [Gemmatimonadaceae bacterium]|nr:DUF92 domain-containing protein [Gemmatimonadaceae bacterium]
MILPTAVAAVLGPAVAGLVWRAGLLTTSGAVAAAALGSATALAGLDWMVLLLAFFATSVVLGRVGRTRKMQRSAAVIAKAGPRDATQVLANGAIFGLGALFAIDGSVMEAVAAVALGGLAAAMADTWGTEIGMLSRQSPRSILTWAPMEPGMSGGVSMLGMAATVGGAITIAGLAAALRWPVLVAVAAAVGGIAGAMADSVLGATVQQRRRSRRTGRMTERMTEADGTPTVAAGGLTWLNNDGVNLASTLIGAGTAYKLHFLLSMIQRP